MRTWPFVLSLLAALAALAFNCFVLYTVAHGETIRDNPGGQIVTFALQIAEVRATGEPVRIDGACDSACTLYLGLPSRQLCVTPRASFGFHLPYGVGAAADRAAADYLLSRYPGWTREWIERHGGLTHDIKRMGANEAAKHLPACHTNGEVI